MSRLSKKPIVIPAKTEVNISESNLVTIKGPLGELTRSFPEVVAIKKEGSEIRVSVTNPHRNYKPLDGTVVSHIKNMIAGVNTAYEKKLLIEGVGFKADAKGTDLVMALGFSHPVILAVPKGLTVKTEKGSITISGINKEEVGAFAAKVRAQKEPEPYKGKGIRYSDEVIRRKQGKKSA
jgi:large subunit ribosomal protein L6